MRKYINTLRSELLEQVIENYIAYITNPCHEWRQELAPGSLRN